MVWSFSSKTSITGFTSVEEAEILNVLQTAYNGSATAKVMFDNWFAVAGNLLNISYVPGVFQAFTRGGVGTGVVQIDPSYIKTLSYINDRGTPVLHSLLGALVHELGHGLTGRRDNISKTDYQGDNVRYVNTIWRELGLEKEISYIAQAKNDMHKVGYQYTNGAAIDAARTGDYVSDSRTGAITSYDWSSSALGTSRDLLIGGPSANILESGGGNDFLFGAGGDDTLRGDAGRDTAVYFGSPLDYDIRKDKDGSWLVRNVRGAKDAGKDRLENIEVVQFDDRKTFDLKRSGLTFQTDFALVVDTTGSMGSSIGRVKTQASSLIDAVFAGGKNDGRIGVVGFKDTTNGEPSRVILPFTDQDEFSARKSTAISAINGITVGGGGDIPETALDGLRLALNGSMGEWRFGAGVRRIALFTDAPAKDGALAGEVNTLAKNIGATITRRSSLIKSGGAVDTFSLAFGRDSVSSAGLFGSDDPNADTGFPVVLSNNPIDPDPTTAEVQIFTIFTGPSGSDTTALSEIASANGGAFLNAPTNDELLKRLLEIINAPRLISGTIDNDKLVGLDGDEQFLGVDPTATTPGRNEVDSFTGGLGSDRFILGDLNRVYYDDVSRRSAGTSDYALITDFSQEQGDIIQLKGKASDYSIGDSPVNGSAGKAIYLTSGQIRPELIAIVQGTPISRFDSAFAFV
jgi:hypothetical protein